MKFPDVEQDKWYEAAIDVVSDLGIMIGDDEGNFRPADPLTRAEAASMIARLVRYINHQQVL